MNKYHIPLASILLLRVRPNSASAFRKSLVETAQVMQQLAKARAKFDGPEWALDKLDDFLEGNYVTTTDFELAKRLGAGETTCPECFSFVGDVHNRGCTNERCSACGTVGLCACKVAEADRIPWDPTLEELKQASAKAGMPLD
jgi:hypothetical protein